MEHGDVGRDEYHGLFIDAGIFQGEDAEQQNIKALWIAVRLLAERVENLDQRSGV